MTKHRLMLIVLAVCGAVAMAAASGAQARTLTAPKNHSNKPTGKYGCALHSLPSFVETGLGAQTSSVADVITVECNPVWAESPVTISSDELYSRCHDNLSWYSATARDHGTKAAWGTGPSFYMELDNDGNATAVVWGGPSCAAGSSIISMGNHTTTYNIIAPQDTKPGVTAMPATEVENSINSSAATIVYAEFPSVNAEQSITVRSNELDSRCAGGVTWVGPDETVLGTGPSVTTTLDDNGNAFVVALAGPSCASGSSQIEASLNKAPFTSYFTSFDILSPRVTEH